MNQISPLSQGGFAVRDYNGPQLALIKQTVAKDCNSLEFDLFIEIARRQGLDPFRKQIYAIVTSKDDAKKRQLVVVTGIDGFRSKAARCHDYRPDDAEPEFVFKDELKDPKKNPLGLEKAVVRPLKQDAQGNWHRVAGFAYWDELAPLKENGTWVDSGEVWEDSKKPKKKFQGDGNSFLDPSKTQWIKSGRNQLAKCAEAQALRKGWPEEFSGLYVAEEMDRTQSREMSASEMVEQQQAETKLMALNHHKAVPLVWEPGQAVEFVPVGQCHDRIDAWLRAQSDDDLGRRKIELFRANNQQGLKHFWAIATNDALAVKKLLEARLAAKPAIIAAQ